MRSVVLVFGAMLFATVARAASPEMGNGYGAIDAVRDISPTELGQLFCAARLKANMDTIVPFIAPKLATLLGAAGTSGAITWQSYDERPHSCSIEIVNGYDNTIGVLVKLTYVSEAHQWSDVLNLERTPESWRLNNIFFGVGGNLRFKLFDNAH